MNTECQLAAMLCHNCARLDVGVLCQFTDNVIENRLKALGYFWHETGDVLCVSHSACACELKIAAATGCELCSIIWTALDSIPLETDETASRLAIVLHTVTHTRIGVSLDSPEDGLVRLCDLDLSRQMSELSSRAARLSLLDIADDIPTHKDTTLPAKLPSGILDQVHQDPSSSECTALASSWVRNCTANHDCLVKEPLDSPSVTRFLHVGDREHDPHLVEFSPREEPKQWAALSYCWGQSRTITLTSSNLIDFQWRIPLSSLEATVVDAITITRALEVEFLWIDALCILQDGAKQDWATQASKMRDLYEKATITLVPVDASSADQGFLAKRHQHYISVPWHLKDLSPDASRDDACQVSLSVSWDPLNDRLRGPWSERGWTLQEGLLPKRLLFFCSTQMVWKCCEEVVYERGEKTVPMHDIQNTFWEEGGRNYWGFDLFTKFQLMPWYIAIPNHNLHAEKYRLWYELVEEFTTRVLTYQSDRLVAISGLATKYQAMLGGDQYLAGFWRADIIRGLLWHVSGQKIFDELTLRGVLGDRYDSPSWSWAGLPGTYTIKNDHAACLDCRPLSVVLDIEFEYKHASHKFGDVQNGVLRLRGPTLYFNKLYHTNWRSPTASLTAFERHISHVIEDQYQQGAENLAGADRYAAVLMLRHMPSIDHRLDVLILKTTSTPNSTIPVYERVGIIKLVYYNHYSSSVLLASHRRVQDSLRYRLGLARGPRRTKVIPGKAVFDELKEKM